MKCLVVTAHPLAGSLCKRLQGTLAGQLDKMGHEVVFEDLYGDGFEPALTAVERQSYYGETYDQSGISASTAKLQNAEALILVFPTWWFGFPAILKGWFDRVWAPGIAFDHASDLSAITPRLNNLKKVIAVTTLGSPWWVDRLILRQPVRRILRVALLNSCTTNCTLQFLSLYSSETLDNKKIESYERKIVRALARWDN